MGNYLGELGVSCIVLFTLVLEPLRGWNLLALSNVFIFCLVW